MEKKKYTNKIPELREATCLASNQGWLLLFQQGMIFFFCPFSGSKIDLPAFPHWEFSGHVGAFSSPPTSPDCTVAYRGSFRTIKCATFHGGVFYFIDDTHKALTFCTNQRSWQMYRIVDSTKHTEADALPFAHKERYFSTSELKKNMEIGDDVSIVTCAASMPGSNYDIVINNEKIDALEGEGADEPQRLKGIWIQPRFFQIPSDYTWTV